MNVIDLTKLSKEELIEQVQKRDALFRELIEEVTIVNQAMAGIYAKPEMKDSGLSYPLDMLAKSITKKINEFNLIIDSLLTKTKE